MSEKHKSIILYGHPACPAVYPVRSVLQQAKVDFEYIDIFQDLQARQHVRDINNGYESVPTLVFPDGSTLSEPSESELRGKLKAMGYTVPLTAILTGHVWTLLLLAGIILALLRVLGVL